jgi:hypothetical protein
MENIIDFLFGNKLTEDTRIQNPIFSIPVGGGEKVCSFVLPEFALYNQLLVVSLKNKYEFATLV